MCPGSKGCLGKNLHVILETSTGEMDKEQSYQKWPTMNSKLLFFIGVVILSLKLLIIDADPPKMDVSVYQPIDEPYYALLAYNYFETGTLFAGDRPVLIGSPLLTNIVTYLSLETFGDNYFGLRFSSMFFSIVAYILFVLLLTRVVRKRVLQFAAVIFFTLNFSFTTANLIVEPTIARMMAALFVLWLVIRWKEQARDDSLSIVWKSMVVCLLFLISYPTNAFLVVAAYISLILTNTLTHQKILTRKRFKEKVIQSLCFTAGAVISLSLYYLIIRILGGNPLKDVLLATSTYENRIAVGPVPILMNWIKLVAGNFFRFNPLFLIFTSLAMIILLVKEWGRLNDSVRITTIFICCFILQSAFINDFPQRKLLILLPFLLLLTTCGLELMWRKVAVMKISTLIIILASSSIPLMLLLYLERDYYRSHPVSLVTAILGVFALLTLLLNKTWKKAASYVLYCLLLLPEIVLFTDYYLLHRTYHYKYVYKNLRVYNGKNFIGGYSIGFRVNNKIIPHYNPYFYRNKMDSFWGKMECLSNNGLHDYSIGYASEEENFKEIGFEPVRVLMSSEETVHNKDWVLYGEVGVKGFCKD